MEASLPSTPPLSVLAPPRKARRLAPWAFVGLCMLLESCSVYDESLLGRGAAGAGGLTNGPDPTGGGDGVGQGGAASGGSAADGGSSSTGGAVHYAYDVIDEVDLDCNNQIPQRSGRQGFWFAFNDGTPGTQVPGPDGEFMATVRPDDAADCAVRVLAEGFTGWGFAVALHFNHDGETVADAYDASTHDGISFWGRVEEGSPGHVRVAVPDVHSTEEGGVCEGDTCNDHYGRTLLLTTAWELYHVPFADLTRRGWGPPNKGFAADQVYGVQFVAQTPSAQSVALWVDEVAFFASDDSAP